VFSRRSWRIIVAKCSQSWSAVRYNLRRLLVLFVNTSTRRLLCHGRQNCSVRQRSEIVRDPIAGQKSNVSAGNYTKLRLAGSPACAHDCRIQIWCHYGLNVDRLCNQTAYCPANWRRASARRDYVMSWRWIDQQKTPSTWWCGRRAMVRVHRHHQHNHHHHVLHRHHQGCKFLLMTGFRVQVTFLYTISK